VTAAAVPLRSATGADIAALAALWRSCGLSVWYNDPAEDAAAFLNAPAHAAILVLEEDGRLLGSVSVCHDSHRGWVYYLAVEPGAQGRGRGRRLMRAAEDWLRERDIPKLNIMVRPSNEAVIAFYRKLGYEDTPRHMLGCWLRPLPPPEPNWGKVETVITYLEMLARPALKPVTLPPGMKVALLRAERPSVAFYRFLYNRVGAQWLWWQRRAMSDADLVAVIHDPKVEVLVLYCNGEPAGYAELDRRQPGDIELAYFGLLPEFLGRKLGPWLLTQTLELAWTYGPERVLVNTNTLDHPKALQLYQRLGFEPYRQETTSFDDPRMNGLIPV
jgi:ribosomal protein S18 acetylase RimI-like enzyme